MKYYPRVTKRICLWVSLLNRNLLLFCRKLMSCGLLVALFFTNNIALGEIAETEKEKGVSEAIAVVVSNSFTKQMVNKSDIQMIFLGRRRLLGNGEKVFVVNLPYNDPLRIDFTQKLLGKRPSAVDAYWARLLFSGQASPPAVVPSHVEVKAWLNKNPSGLGYIRKSSVDDSVKVIYLIE